MVQMLTGLEKPVDVVDADVPEEEEEVYVFPLSFAQERLWFLDQFEPNSPFYNIPAAVRLTGELDVAALERTLNEIVRRHEILRTTFATMNREPVQVISPTLTLSLPVTDLQDLPRARREAEAMRLATEEAQRPFELTRGPLVRAALLRLAQEEHIVLLTMHHIVSDGWSMGVLVAEIAAIYEAFSKAPAVGRVSIPAVAGSPSPLPELPIQYADFALWQREWLQGEVLQAQLDYWKHHLDGSLGVLELPTDRPRPPVQTNRGATQSRKLPGVLTEALKSLGKQERTTLFMTLLAAFQTLLHRYSRQDSISVGSPIANRNRAEMEGLIGFFVNTLVLRTDFSGDPSFRQLLARVRQVTLEAYAHQDLPFEMLVDALHIERDMSHSPLFQVMFILQNAPVRARELSGLTLSQIETHSGTSTFDLTLSITEQMDGLDASAEYNTDLFDAPTITRMLGHFRTLLEGIVAAPDQRISALPILAESEQRALLVDWNETATPYRQDVCVQQLFEAQVERTPDAVAVVVPLAPGGPQSAQESKAAPLNMKGSKAAPIPLAPGGPQSAQESKPASFNMKESKAAPLNMKGSKAAPFNMKGSEAAPSIDSGRREVLTYRELNGRANQLAHHLRKLGVGPETTVGVCVERSLEMIVGVMGVVKAGGVYLPLDPLYPHERLAFMLEDAQVPLLLTQHHLLDRLPSSILHSSLSILLLDTDWPTIAQEPDDNPTHVTTPENLVYVTYTSGSTGQSKGVMIQHHSLVNAYLAWEDAYDLQTTRSHLQMANFSFDVFSGDLVRALCSGGKLVLCPREWLLASQRLVALMHQEEIDCAEFVPAVLRNLVHYLDESGQCLDFMRVLVCGSDSWYMGEHTRFLRSAGPETRLINSFGLTEATIDSSYFEGKLDLSADQVVPIGRPFANMQLYVLDEHWRPVPVGVPGELYVGGRGVTRGYHDRPELTAERFIPDPFGDEPGGRLYRTGDQARYLPDGNVEFLGRIDHQVKIRGFRIEPGEIEATLGRHPAVRQAVVMPVEATPGDKRLAAYVVPNQPSAIAPGQLRRFLQDRLPDYMVPSAFVLIDELPLMPNGKVDRRALPAPEWSRQQLEGKYVAPRTPVEEVLAGIWARVLGINQVGDLHPGVGVHDNFFELGGHSLLATQLVSRVREAFEIELPLRNVFESPTVAALAERVEIAQRTEAGVLAPPIQPVPRDQELPLSFAQQRLWFLDQLEPNSPFYNLPEAVRLTGPLDVQALESGLNEIIRRHEALRTSFQTMDGRPVQIIAPELIIPLPVMDLQHLPHAQREAEALRVAREQVQQPFDLARGPLLRARLLRMGEEEHIVLLTMHHIIGDNWSTSVLVQELAILYDAFSQASKGRPASAGRAVGRVSIPDVGRVSIPAVGLPDLSIQYADFAHWQRQWLQGEVLEAQLAYWKRQLEGLPPVLELPTDRPRPPVLTYPGDYQSFVLPEKLSGEIRDLCQQEGVTLFMALLAAFQTLLYRYTGQEDISVGSPIANRNRAEIEGLIGFFVNTLVMRTDLSGDPSFRELLKRVREMALGAYAHQDLPFEMIVDALQPERNLSHSPLFQVMFALQSSPVQAPSLPSSGLTIGPVETHSGTAKFDLTLFMVDDGDQLGGALEYNTDLFDAATIQRMLCHFQSMVEAIAADPGQPISTLPLLTEAERQKLLVEWNDTQAPTPHHRCVHHLFEAQVERTPARLAVTFEDEALTYLELDRRANQLAHRLNKMGVGPETLVCICVERSLEMIVGLLGVLKAGGAYVPLDPTYPQERLAFMLEDSQVPVLLTQHHLLDRLPPSILHSSLSILLLDTDWPLIAQEPDDNPSSPVTPDNLAYVIYTSGSTGKPKGAMIPHRGLVNYLTWCQRAYPVAAGQGAPVHSSVSFDLTITGLFAPLLAGRRVKLLPEDIGVEILARALQEETDYSLVKITPAHLELLSHQLSPEAVAGRTRAFIIGGENLLAESITFWQDHSPDTVLVNEYGPTETVVGCCVYQVPKGERRPGSVPIGYPIINTQLYVLDEHLQPVPIGVPGELYIGGTGVARGYLHRPDLTAERFIPDPFQYEGKQSGSFPTRSGRTTVRPVKPGARLYKTGDLARYLPDGNIEFLGRTDHQCKIRGFRIELGEIEAVLSQHPAVRETVALAREDEPGHKKLVAYVVPDPTLAPAPGDLRPQELRRFLEKKLPDYMVPSAFVFLDALPLTPNGKVDRRALPAPEPVRPDLEAAYVPPRTPEEEILTSIWTQVLGLERVGVHDSFFELGGDSILSIQVIARANQAGLRLTPRQIFQYPTVAGQAMVADKGRQVQAEQGLVEGSLPLTPIQHWFFEQSLPEPNHWNHTLLLEVHQQPEREYLERAVSALLAHHDALRLRFAPTESGWQQRYAGLEGETPLQYEGKRSGSLQYEGKRSGSLSWVDLSELPEADRPAAIETHATNLQASLDLIHGPLMRVAYFDLEPGPGSDPGPGSHPHGRLLVTVHHLAMDGVSWRILLEDLQALYGQTSRGEPASLPPKTTSFRYWAERLVEYAQSDPVREELDYWLGLPWQRVPRLPVDHSRGENSEASARSVTVGLSTEETRTLLQEVPAAYHTEIVDVLLTALTEAFARWTGQRILLVDLEGHGREDLFDEVDLSRTVGWFTALFPVVVNLEGVKGPGETLKAVKEQLRRIPQHGLGYGLLRYLSEDAEAVEQLRALPPAQVSFNYLGQFDRVLEGPSAFGPAQESTGPSRSPKGQRTHLLEVNGGIAGGRLQLEWSYSENLHRRSTIERLARDLIQALRALIAHCQSPEAGGYTPSDFADFAWEQSDLEDIVAEISRSMGQIQ